MLSYLRRHENVHYQSRIGLLDHQQWEGVRETLLRNIRQPGFRAWWKGNAATMNSGFRAFIEEHLAVPDENVGAGD